jgi:signal transduction histidine kinase
MVVGILVSLLALFLITSRLLVRTFESISTGLMTRGLDQAELRVNQYFLGQISLLELHESFNPDITLNVTVFACYGPDHQIVAASDQFQKYISELILPADLESQTADTFIELLPENRLPISRKVLVRPLYIDDAYQGFLAAGINLSDLQLAHDRFNRHSFLVIWPLFFLISGLTFLIVRRLASPVQILTAAARRISSGDLTVRINRPLPGEMGELATAFNDMSANLSQTIQSLQLEKESITLMLEGLQEGIIAMQTSGEILHQNSASDALLGGAGSPAWQSTLQMLQQVLLNGQPAQALYQVSERSISCSVQPVPTGKDQGGAIALLRDTTASMRLEQTRRDYVSNISHELRTPLTALRSLTEPLRDGLVHSETDRQRCYAIIAAETARLAKLVDDLMELSGLQSGHALFVREPTDLADLLSDLYYRNLKLFEDSELVFRLDLPDSLPEVSADEDRLIQVMTILLDNALKYTPKGGTVLLRACVAGQSVQISVCDTGTGMDEVTQRHAFERFYQGDHSRQDRGSGLGLAIAQEIIDRLQLKLAVASKPGQGSTFTLSVPLPAVNQKDDTITP